jgi:hypothetical protein
MASGANLARSETMSRWSLVRQPEALALLGAFGAFSAANLIHNNFGLDVAIAPPAIFTALYCWRQKGWLLHAANFFIAIPAFLFLKPSALLDLSRTPVFINHLALLLAGMLSVISTLISVLARRKAISGVTETQ